MPVLIFALGVLLVAAGLALIWPPLAFLAAGAALIRTALVLEAAKEASDAPS